MASAVTVKTPLVMMSATVLFLWGSFSAVEDARAKTEAERGAGRGGEESGSSSSVEPCRRRRQQHGERVDESDADDADVNACGAAALAAFGAEAADAAQGTGAREQEATLCMMV